MRPVTLAFLAAALVVACLPPPDPSCTPAAQRCSATGVPEACSTTGRAWAAGDGPCSTIGGACVTDGGVAFCAPADAGRP